VMRRDTTAVKAVTKKRAQEGETNVWSEAKLINKEVSSTEKQALISHRKIWGMRSRYNWRSVGQSVSQSVSMSWRRAHIGTCDQTFRTSNYHYIKIKQPYLIWQISAVDLSSTYKVNDFFFQKWLHERI
jgi:hypothetical protein